MTAQPFKVIIVGGGPSGITAAHILHRAGIESVVLERRDSIVEDVGASLVLSPGSLRVFHQLGILDQLMEICSMLSASKGFTTDGKVFKQFKIGQMMLENHGTGLATFHRAHLVQVLYDTLPECVKARYHTGKKVTDITPTDGGVVVTCEDGSSYSGNMVIGADGVHSATRRQMRKLALAEDPTRTWDPVNPFKVHYQCLWASFPRPSAAGEGFETQGTDRSIMYLTGKERGWIFLYEKLPAPTSERISFTPEQLEEYAGRFAEWPVTDTLKVKDVFSERYSVGGAGLEEGICSHWSWGGRIVLVGDAAHKFTPNAGLGFNNGIQDVVALCNRLRPLVQESSSAGGGGGGGGQPLTADLHNMFDMYQKERRAPLEVDLKASARVTRMHAWASTWHWLLARYLMAFSFVQKIFFSFALSPTVQQSRVLDFVTATEVFEGNFKWLHPLPSDK